MAKNKLILCKSCDAEIAASAKTCPHCGAKNKKPFYKKAWFWVLVVFLLIGMAGGDEEATEPTSATATESIAETIPKITLPIETTTVTTTPAEIPTEDPTIPTEENNQVSVDVVASLIEANAAQNFTHYDLSYDETGITLSVWEDGLSAGAALASSGASEYLTLWNEMVDNIEGMGKATVDFAKTYGRDDLLICVNVLNDTNHDNILIMIMNGVVVYDAVNSK